MSKAVFGILVALVLVTGLAFRLARLDARPMHHDEANQAVKFGTLLESNDYRYDASDHHGPTLYYLTLPAAWLRGQRTLAALDETTVRLVPACFGIALILVMLSRARGLGRPGVVIAAALAAVSPALTYYSRFYIQEMAFACFSLAFLVAAGRYLERATMGRACWAGLWAGLAMATKETWMITLPAAVVACAAAWWPELRQGWSLGLRPETARDGERTTRRGGDRSGRGARLRPPREALRRDLAAALSISLLIACLFYSSFFTHPSGIAEWLRSFPIYGSRGLGDGRHDEPWFYYLHLIGFWRSGGLLFTEAIVLALAALGIALAFVPRRILSKLNSAADTGEQPVSPTVEHAVRFQPCVSWPRAIALYAILTTAIFSAIPYKTPWNVVPCYAATVLIAGWGGARILAVARPTVLRAVLLAVLGAGLWHLGAQAWRADVRYAADPRNPWVYAHTTTDFLRLPTRIQELAALHPDRRAMLVKVLAGPYEQWPMPWYLRKLTRVGYWSQAAEAAPLNDASVLVASQENVPAVDAMLGDRYVSEFYGLRPGVLLTVYVERGLWERYLAGHSAPGTRN